VARAALVVALIGLGDSLNPATIAPAMFLATREHPTRRVAEFLIGFLGVNLLAGLLIMLGPGELLLAILPKPSREAKHIIELVAGIGLLVLAAGIFSRRSTLRQRSLPASSGRRRTGVALGAGLAAVELPTALPYFAAIAIIVGTDASIPGQILLLAIFNVCFTLPVIALLVALLVAGDRAKPVLTRANTWLQHHWPAVLAGILGVIGAVVAALGLAGIVTD